MLLLVVSHVFAGFVPYFGEKFFPRSRKTTLNQIAERLLQSEDLRERPIFACGIHLCNTLLGGVSMVDEFF